VAGDALAKADADAGGVGWGAGSAAGREQAANVASRVAQAGRRVRVMKAMPRMLQGECQRLDGIALAQ
jgi:hypothetical protein